MNLTFKLVFDESADDQYGFYRHYRKTIRRTYQDLSIRPNNDFLNFKQYIHFTRFKNNHRLQKMFTPCSNSFLLSAQKIACLSKVKRILPVFVKIPYLKLLEDYFVKFLNISVFTLEREL